MFNCNQKTYNMIDFFGEPISVGDVVAFQYDRKNRLAFSLGKIEKVVATVNIVTVKTINTEHPKYYQLFTGKDEDVIIKTNY